jgi:cytochrome b involved in lipid metabolism
MVCVPESILKEHNKKEDIWIMIKGRVYDVTKFIESHPGGSDVLLEVAGKDATTEFEDIGHSADAFKILDELFVGDVAIQ